MSAYWAFLGLLAFERVGELVLSKRNAAWALAQGGHEVGQRHYVVMTAFHTAFLICCALEPVVLQRPFPGVWGFVALGAALLAQALRYWAIATLGRRWNTRVIVLPEASPVTGGPYRFIKHPNYVAVGLELLAVPLIHGAWLTALVFSIGNLLLLRVRISVEEQALGPKWKAAFEGKGRFVPGAHRG
ncbi:MAG: isoprenylcysteine carboxylmethyltransferase family protein [Myxococcaceae bacterium]